MKNKFNLTASIFQIIFGGLAILSYIVLAASGENMIKWTVSFILSIAFVVLGIIGILDYKSNK